MKRAVLFLHGRYRQKDFDTFQNLCKGAFTIAVDAGYRFFKRADIVPDLLVGDFDSLKRVPTDLTEKTEVIEAPTRKDQTDAEIALVYALDREFEEIDIVQPSHGESDHFIANIMLLQLITRLETERPRPRVRIVSPADEIFLLHDDDLTISKAKGDRLSVIPLSDNVRLSCTGTDYDVQNVPLKVGQTRGLRNRIMKSRANFRIKGKALIVHQFND